MLLGDGVNKGNYYQEINKFLTNQNKNIDMYNYSKKNLSIKELTTDLIYQNNPTLKEYLIKSNLIVLSIGEKEIKDNESLLNIETDMNNLIQEIKKYNYNICILSKYKNNINDKKVSEINKIYKSISKENNLIYINIENIPILNNNYPSKKGNKDIGNLIVKAIDLKYK